MLTTAAPRNEKKRGYYQQGDVILRPISKLPEGLTEQESKVLQHGETTGHMHQFDRDSKVSVYVGIPEAAAGDLNFTTITENGNKYVVVEAPALLRHEEHKAFEVPPGIYQIDIVREFNYEKYEASRVVD